MAKSGRRNEVPIKKYITYLIHKPKKYISVVIKRYLAPSETQTLVILSIIVGIGAGLGAFLFRWLITLFTALFFTTGAKVLSFLGRFYVVLIPAVGGLIYGPLIYFFAKEAKGHGVPEVMYAVSRKGGKIRPVVAAIKSLASSICIGCGGAVGREGPIVQIGASIASSIGQIFKLPANLIRILVAAGAAGGIAATFNAPIAGVMFAMEIILREFSANSFSIVVLSSVTASIVTRALIGESIVFAVPEYALLHVKELFIYLFLGCLAAPVAKFYTFSIYKLEDIFEKWKKLPEYFKPVVGGFILGTIGLFLPQIFGIGYETVELALYGKLTIGLMLILCIMKIFATSITLGCGGSGGVFAPSLFIGAVLGGLVGKVGGSIFTGIASSGAYALVGMAAVFAAATHAPITAIIILFEMTGDYKIILPVMMSTVVAVLIAKRINPESIYSLKLFRRGIKLRKVGDIGIVETIPVKDLMTRKVEKIREDLTLNEFSHFVEKSRHSGFPVVNNKDELVGLVTYEEMHSILTMEIPSPRLIIVRDFMREHPSVVFPDQKVTDVIRMLPGLGVDRLPVVEHNNPKKVIGIITQADVLGIYKKLFGS